MWSGYPRGATSTGSWRDALPRLVRTACHGKRDTRSERGRGGGRPVAGSVPCRRRGGDMLVDGGIGAVGRGGLAAIGAQALGQEDVGYDGIWSAETSHD